jgi:hypothetical protein
MEQNLLEIKLCGSVPDDVCGSALGWSSYVLFYFVQYKFGIRKDK